MSDLELTLDQILPQSRSCSGCGEPTAAYNCLGVPQCFSCFVGDALADEHPAPDKN